MTPGRKIQNLFNRADMHTEFIRQTLRGMLRIKTRNFGLFVIVR
jgi:hypothetical protein